MNTWLSLELFKIIFSCVEKGALIIITLTCITFFIESNSCTPNPCRHNGKCKIVNNNFECDCAGTFYRGKFCERGVLIVPEISILSVYQTKSNLKIQGYPINHIIVTLISSPDVLIKPSKITLTRNKTSATFAVTVRKYGFVSIKYNVSGENADEFEKPDSTVLFVDEANKTIFTPICYPCGGILAKGCFMETVNNRSFTSNLKWSSLKKSFGITQILAYENKTLPLSLTGGQIMPSGTIKTYSLRNEVEVNNAIRFIDNCSNKREKLVNIGNILRTNTFEYSIQVFFNAYTPSWFKLIAASNINEYYKNDLYAELYLGSEMQEKSDNCIGGFRFKSNNTYYIHHTNQVYNILLPQNFIELPNFCTKCFIMDLDDKYIYFGFSRKNDINAESDQIYKDIIQNFSSNISSLIGFHIISSFISFDLVGSSHMLKLIGKQNYSISFGDLNVRIVAEGQMSFISDENFKSYKEMTLGENGFVDFTIKFTVNDKVQSIQINGLSSEVNSYKEIKSNKVAKVLTTIFPIRNIFQTSDLSNIFKFSGLSPLSLNITYDLVTASFKEKVILNNILNQVNKAKEIVSATLIFLTRLSVNEYLRDNLNTLQNSMKNLMKAILSFSNNYVSVFRDIEVVRFLLSEELKKFSVLLHQYVQSNPLDHVEMKLRFLNFKNQYDEFIQNTNVNSRQQYEVGEMYDITIESEGQLCVEYFCFTQLALIIHLYQKKIVGQFVSKDHIGKYVKIFPHSKIYYNLEKKIKSLSLKGEVLVFNQAKEIDISIQKALLSFHVDARIGNEDLIPLHVEASLEAVLRDDPLYFVFSGNMEKSTQIKKDIEAALRDYFSKLEQTLNSREASISSLQSSAQRLLDQVNNKTAQMKVKVQQLKNQIQSVNTNITGLEILLNTQKEAYKKALRQHSNLASSQIQTLVEQCQPKLCNSSCIPGLKKEICSMRKQVPLIDQQCHLENTTTIVYENVKVNRSALTTKLEKKTDCWSECPPLKKFWNSLGKRKRRGIVTNVLGEIVTEVAPTIFEKVGGEEGKIGAEIGGMIFGPLGSIGGGFIGSLFGSCDRYCAYDYVPVPSIITLQEYEVRPVVKQIQRTHCKSNIRYVNGSTESVYECAVKAQCLNVFVDKSCLKKQLECSHLREIITNSILDKSTIQKKFQELTKTSYIYDLLITKRNMLVHQSQNIEQELAIAHALNTSTQKTHLSLENTLKKFEEATKNDRLLIEKHKTQPNLFKSVGLKFNFSYTSGMEFPKQFLIEIYIFSLSSTILFDVNNYKKSVQAISLEITDLVKQTFFGKRKRRSTEDLQPNPNDKKCLLIQQAEMFLLEILTSYKDKLNEFRKLKSDKLEQTKASEEDMAKLKQNISIQFAAIADNSTEKLLNKELNTIFAKKLQDEKDISMKYLWNSTIIEILSRLQVFVFDQQSTDCVNLLDCLQFYTDILISITALEEDMIALNITNKIEDWKLNLLQLISAYPNIDHAEKLIATTTGSISEINPTQWFCGNPPSLKMLLADTIVLIEGESFFLNVHVLNKRYNYQIIWKRNNHVLQGYNTTVLSKTVTKGDEGYYSCEITNKFGVSNCGSVFVKVFENIKFLIEPQDTIGYLHSSKKLYLTCTVSNNTSNGTFAWYYRKFDEPATHNVLISESESRIEINQNTVYSSGFYTCQYTTKLVRALSRKAVVHVLKTSIAVERIRVIMLFSKSVIKRLQSEGQDDDTEIKLELAKLLLAKSEQISIEDRTEDGIGKERMKFILSSKNSTNVLEKSDEDDITDKILKERENFLLRLVYLYVQANNSKNFTVNNKIYSIDQDSISIETMDPLCPYNQVLEKNGYICGKFYVSLIYSFPETKQLSN